MNSKGPLTQEKIDGYRRWLEELNGEPCRSGAGEECDPEIWAHFNPRNYIGRQVYESFSDEELLNVVIRTMDRPGHKPRFDEVHYIYKQYLCSRFKDLNNVKVRACNRMKQRREEEKWPHDWPKRVSPAPLLEWCEKRGKPVSPKALRLIHTICDTARATELPPQLSQEERGMLSKLMSYDRALELMGIPALNRAGLRHMIKYWEKQRRRRFTAACTMRRKRSRWVLHGWLNRLGYGRQEMRPPLSASFSLTGPGG